jgi:predicted RNase H-like nuclease (RuvC/YqgF family)
MDELFYFIGGILLSGLIGLVVWVSSNKKEIVKIKQEDSELLEYLKVLQNEVKDLELKVHKYVDDIYRNTEDKFNNYDRGLDSRLDKMENRLQKMNEDGCKPVDKLKNQING